jgi:hypothetical protein
MALDSLELGGDFVGQSIDFLEDCLIISNTACICSRFSVSGVGIEGLAES